MAIGSKILNLRVKNFDTGFKILVLGEKFKETFHEAN